MCVNRPRPLCAGKVLKELIEPYSLRVQRLQEFLRDIKPSLQVEIVPLDDPFGVSVADPLLQCIVVSEETRKGGEAVNKKRIENVGCFYVPALMSVPLVPFTNSRSCMTTFYWFYLYFDKQHIY